MHRDLKPKNIFITEGHKIRLGDFGCSKLLKRGSLARTQIGTPYYMSPEIFANRRYNEASDMWAVGCIVYELTTAKPPFQASDIKGLSRKVQYNKTPRLPSHYSSELNNLVHRLLCTYEEHYYSL